MIAFSDVTGPLAQFQAKKANGNSTLELVKAINNRHTQPVPPERLEELFGLVWPRLEKALAIVPKASGQIQPQRSQREVLEELVQVVRTVERRTRVLDHGVPEVLVPPDWEREAKAQLARREKIAAIKTVRQATNLGLKEAKDLVESWEVPVESDWKLEARNHLRSGNKIAAIKVVREATGLDLKEAKDLVESWPDA